MKWNSTSTQQHVYLSKSNEELWNLEQTSPKQCNFAPKQNSQALKTAGYLSKTAEKLWLSM